MRGAGGPLLCIGDLLSDVADDDGADGAHQDDPTPPPTADPLLPSDLHRLFEENYNQLIDSLAGNDHSWTALTLKLCAALKTADTMVNSSKSNIDFLLEKAGDLESILKRGDSAVATATAILTMQSKEDLPAA